MNSYTNEELVKILKVAAVHDNATYHEKEVYEQSANMLEELQKDKERLDWLQNQNPLDLDSWKMAAGGVNFNIHFPTGKFVESTDLREAIDLAIDHDAAMQPNKPEL